LTLSLGFHRGAHGWKALGLLLGLVFVFVLVDVDSVGIDAQLREVVQRLVGGGDPGCVRRTSYRPIVAAPPMAPTFSTIVATFWRCDWN
jgi:hypothetical protein